jgi:N-methylhydantoinase A
MAYLGQIHTLRVPIERNWPPERISAAFHELYRREYGNTLGDIPAMIVSLKTVVQGTREHPKRSAAASAAAKPPNPTGQRRVHFGKWFETPVYIRRDLLPGMTLSGPAIVEQPDTTTVIEPDMRCRVDGYGNLLVELA